MQGYPQKYFSKNILEKSGLVYKIIYDKFKAYIKCQVAVAIYVRTYCMDHVSFLQKLLTQQIFCEPIATYPLVGQCFRQKVATYM